MPCRFATDFQGTKVRDFWLALRGLTKHIINRTTDNKPTRLLQKVMIIGLRATFFQQAMDVLQEVNLIAEGEFHQGELETWALTMFRGALVMECTNQHFKKLWEDLSNIVIPFPKEVNPGGTLKQLTRPNLAHIGELGAVHQMLDQWRQEKKVSDTAWWFQ